MATIKLFDKMLQENPIIKVECEAYGLFEDDIQFIKDLVYEESLKLSDENVTYEEKV
jgi:hypothetical protein